jgi:hypothetical protein
VCAQVTLTKTDLSAVRTFSPLGVNNAKFWRLLVLSKKRLMNKIVSKGRQGGF